MLRIGGESKAFLTISIVVQAANLNKTSNWSIKLFIYPSYAFATAKNEKKLLIQIILTRNTCLISIGVVKRMCEFRLTAKGLNS